MANVNVVLEMSEEDAEILVKYAETHGIFVGNDVDEVELTVLDVMVVKPASDG